VNETTPIYDSFFDVWNIFLNRKNRSKAKKSLQNLKTKHFCLKSYVFSSPGSIWFSSVFQLHAAKYAKTRKYTASVRFNLSWHI